MRRLRHNKIPAIKARARADRGPGPGGSGESEGPRAGRPGAGGFRGRADRVNPRHRGPGVRRYCDMAE
jgi:hypothetical protein